MLDRHSYTSLQYYYHPQRYIKKDSQYAVFTTESVVKGWDCQKIDYGSFLKESTSFQSINSPSFEAQHLEIV